MSMLRDKALLQRFRLTRADLVAAIAGCELPPHRNSLRDLADLQLAIMATEQVIKDKQDASFLRSLENLNAA